MEYIISEDIQLNSSLLGSFMTYPLQYSIPEAVTEDTGMSDLNKKGENVQISPNG